MARENLDVPQAKPQRDRFIEKARELECDEGEDRLNETLKRVVRHRPDKGNGRSGDAAPD